ncbi:MAG: glutathione-dependent formaldehyde dehydrogenase [Jiangellaceae bacterium]|nr:glutathione-dependent formaldehyde dehydrogenase [Jiangellaceae bacterium]
MRAVTWHGVKDVRVEDVPDPKLQEPTDAIIRVTSTAICGSDLHLYGPLAMFMDVGDVIGHEPMGVVEEVGAEATRLQPGDRVVVPFNIACGRCRFCRDGLMSQCETTQVIGHGTGGALLGYSRLYGSVPGGQAEYLRVPQAQFGPVVVPSDGPDERYLFLSDVLPTAWQAVAYAGLGPGSSVAVWGLGPVGQFCARIARHLGAQQVIGLDRLPERLTMAERHGVVTINVDEVDDPPNAVLELTGGYGPDAVIEAVGMEAHGAPFTEFMQKAVARLPGVVARPISERAGIDRLNVLYDCIEAVCRGGTISVVGVYGGSVDPLPMMRIFDKQVTLRFGQANVRRWTDDILPLLTDQDPLGVMDLVTHRLPLGEAPEAYRMFQEKRDGCIKVVLQP